MALETFRGINVGGEKDRVLVNVGTRRICGKQQEERNRERAETNEAVAQVRERGSHSPRAKILCADPYHSRYAIAIS